jgi:ribosomal protein S27E
MTSEVIELNDRRPHTAKRVVCMNCVNTWVAVFPSNTTGLECSECGAMEGEPFQSNNFEWFRRFMDRSEQHKTKKMREASVKKRTLVLIIEDMNRERSEQ